MSRIQINIIALAIFGLAAAASGQTTVPVTLAWTSSPTVDEEGQELARAVEYEVYLQRAGATEFVVATVEDTVYTLEAEYGIVQRIRVIGYDAAGRASEPSEWSDPIYIESNRGSESGDGSPPDIAILRGNYPNPFNPETAVLYGVPENLPAGTPMALEIYNLRGQRVRRFDVEDGPGWHEVSWNGMNDRGQLQSTGTYIARYVCGDRVQVSKMTMVK